MKRALPLPLLLCLASAPALAQKSRPLPAVCKEDLSECREDCSSDYGGSTRTFKQLTACISGCNERLDLCRDRHYTALDSGLAPGALDRPRAADPAAVEPSRRHRATEERPEYGGEDVRPAAASREDVRPAAASEDVRPAAAASEPEPGPAPLRRDVYRAVEPPAPKKAEPAPALAQDNVDDSADDELPSLVQPQAEVKPAAQKEPAPEVKPAVLKESRPAATVRESDPGDDAEPLPPPPPPKPKVEPKPAEPLRPPPPPEPKKKDISEWDPNAED